jgi:hypothetical protein
MSSNFQASGLLDALEAVFRWRQEQESELRNGSVRLLDEERQLHRQLEEVARQIEEIRGRSQALEDRLTALDEEEAERARVAVGEGLLADRQLIIDRAGRLQRARAANATRNRTSLAGSAQVALIDVDLSPITVVAGIERSLEGTMALEIVVPVPFTVYSHWKQHSDDLCARFAWRMVGAMTHTLAATGLSDAPVRFADRSGCLSVQVWVGGRVEEQPLRDALSSIFDHVYDAAAELREAGLELHAAWLDPDILAPREVRAQDLREKALSTREARRGGD